MKKLLAAAVAAMVAGSAFAVDVSSMIQIDGDVANYDGSSFKALMLKDYDPAGDSDYLWKLSASGDNAGGEIWSWAGLTSAVSSVKIWMAPTDWLKVTVGNVGGQSIANPNFGWWAQTAQNYAYGYQCEVTFGAFNAKVALEPGAGKYWIDGGVGGFWAEASYDLGKIGKFQAVATMDGTIGAHGYSSWASSDLAFGIAYQNMPYGQTGVYADAFVSFMDNGSGLEFQGVDSQIGGQWNSGFGLMIQETNLIQYRSAFKYGFELKATYDFGAVVTPYVQIDGYDIMAKSMTVDAGIDTSIGGCAINACLRLPFNFSAYTFNFSVPVQFTINL